MEKLAATKPYSGGMVSERIGYANGVQHHTFMLKLAQDNLHNKLQQTMIK